MPIDESRPFQPVRIALLTVSDTRTLADDSSGDILAARIADASSGEQMDCERLGSTTPMAACRLKEPPGVSPITSAISAARSFPFTMGEAGTKHPSSVAGTSASSYHL